MHLAQQGASVIIPANSSRSFSSQRIISIVCGIPRHKWGDRFMGMFAAYVDDSGTHAQSKHYVLGGVVSSVEEWLEFDKAWDALLKQYEISWFHMTDAESGAGEFKKFKKRKRIEIIQQFAIVVHNFSHFYCYSRVDHVAWNKIMPHVLAEHPYYGDIIGSAYLTAYSCIVHSLADACKNNCINPNNVDLFFAKQKLGNDIRNQLYVSCEATGFSEPLFREPREFLPLQAADMFAWKEYKYLNFSNGWVANRHKMLHGHFRYKRECEEPHIYEMANNFREKGRRLASTYEWLSYAYPRYKLPDAEATIKLLRG